MPNTMDPRGLSPVTLAFLGDCVFELFVREAIVLKGSVPAGKLHHMAVKRVKAAAQALTYDEVFSACGEEEQSILKRGRNVSVSRLPHSCTPEEYHKATAIEALMGYLYLKGERARLRELYELIDTILAREENPHNVP